MKQHGEIHDFRMGSLGRAVSKFLRNPRVAGSVVLMAASFFAFMQLLSFEDLSFAVPATAASFVLETLLAGLLLKEHIGGLRWAGALLVACGVALVAL
jgi:drug/metabolite transporter (DMT)-like permease